MLYRVPWGVMSVPDRDPRRGWAPLPVARTADRLVPAVPVASVRSVSGREMVKICNRLHSEVGTVKGRT